MWSLSAVNNPALTAVLLAGNLWSCGCAYLEEFSSWLDVSAVVQDRQLITCTASSGETVSDLGNITIPLYLYIYFLVAKLLYKYKCPSVCMYVCMSGLGGNVIFSAPIFIRWSSYFLCAHSSCIWASILQIFCPSVCRSGYKRHKSFAIYGCCHPCFYTVLFSFSNLKDINRNKNIFGLYFLSFLFLQVGMWDNHNKRFGRNSAAVTAGNQKFLCRRPCTAATLVILLSDIELNIKIIPQAKV